MKTICRLRFLQLWALKVAFLVSFFAPIPFAVAQNRSAVPADAECLACHGQPDLKSQTGKSVYVDAARHKAGVHAALNCTDCHTDIRGFPHPETVKPVPCSSCHMDEAGDLQTSVHAGLGDDSCAGCHGPAHDVVAPARLVPQACAKCHASESTDFRSGIHGAALQSGDPQSPNCLTCHGPAHKILTAEDPASPSAKKNQPATCGACHAGAGQSFAIGPVHVSTGARAESAAVRWIRLIYLILIPVTVGFMLFHHSLDFWRKFRSRLRAAAGRKQVLRMNLHFRIAHWLAVISFPVLVITGFALKFPEAWWARPMLLWESRFAFRGTVHRIAGIVLLASLAYHLIHLLFVRRDRAFWREMLPNWSDLRDLRQMLEYNLGIRDARPEFGRFSYVEKIEYFAFLWGVAIMAASGFYLWFDTAAMRYFPKWVSDAATTLHFYEAMLATAAIAIWHMYTVVFDPDVYPMDHAWLTGRISAEHVRRARPGYYAQLTTAGHPQAAEQNQVSANPPSTAQR